MHFYSHYVDNCAQFKHNSDERDGREPGETPTDYQITARILSKEA
jgi:hypothetical protein